VETNEYEPQQDFEKEVELKAESSTQSPTPDLKFMSFSDILKRGRKIAKKPIESNRSHSVMN
jgi:hypothetical protein